MLRSAFADTGAAAGSGVGYFALVEGVIFVVILFLGLAYVWAKGDLDWVLSYTGKQYQPPERRPRVRPANVAEIEAERGAASAKAPAEPETVEAAG